METLELSDDLYHALLKYMLSEDEYAGLQGLPKSYLAAMFPELLHPPVMFHNFKYLWNNQVEFLENTWSQPNEGKVQEGRDWILSLFKMHDGIAFQKALSRIPAFTFSFITPTDISYSLMTALIPNQNLVGEIEKARSMLIHNQTVLSLSWKGLQNPNCPPDHIIVYEQLLLPAYLDLLKLG